MRPRAIRLPRMEPGPGHNPDAWRPHREAETRAVINGLEVHETALILHSEAPSHLLTNESCADAQPGWKIMPGSVKAEVIAARMMDPGGDPDWKVEKAEARTG